MWANEVTAWYDGSRRPGRRTNKRQDKVVVDV